MLLLRLLVAILVATTVSSATGDAVPRVPITPSEIAPDWAKAQRELLVQNWDVVDAMVQRQRHNVAFWGQPDEYPFIPLDWAAPPFLGHDQAKASWLQFYAKLEDNGGPAVSPVQKKPVDPDRMLKVTGSRALTLYYAPGDPQVFERELNTAKHYSESVAEAKVNRAHLGWWWGETETPPPHVITDRAAVAAQMLQVAKESGDAALRSVYDARVGADYPPGIGRDILIYTALGGRIQEDSDLHPPSIAVSWEKADTPELARLVSYADDSRLVVNAFTLLEQGMSTEMRVWRLQPGTYKLTVGLDVNDDGVIDGAPKREETLQLDRLTKIPLYLFPGENTVVSLELIAARKRAKQLPDLAITYEDVVVDGYTVHVAVHNIGAATAENVRVGFFNPSGDLLEEKIIPRLESPRVDLSAKRATIDLKLHDREVIIYVDSSDEIDEILEENNDVSFFIPHGKSEAVLAKIQPATEAQIEQAAKELTLIDKAINTYKDKFGSFPKLLNELLAPPAGPALLENEETLLDPWGNYYGYRVVRLGRAAIIECWTPDDKHIWNDGSLD